ncbi:MAG: nuclear transport factor 2 family protein [Pseudomonadota bacterium]|jgi:steroid delta-isomerase|nr:nuclear transport factor 2 family protein [Rubrivivax sp.]MCA3258963.1 nuclear transport factor 2 family protein [Rubrivivax sp.]MCE2912986.1 nuclear transport factor 2 family protein [Rubrivivax sp.]MCZ8032109.1 nuclear transport factor 2 family protein [Rubrivivax sp.]
MADPAALERIRVYFERLAREDLARIGEIYTDDARFKDPFNEVAGTDAIARIFEHMFATLERPRFVVHEVVADGVQVFLTWDFLFDRDGRPWQVRGASHLRLAADGRIAVHRDYWDAAEELWAKMPLVGGLVRWLTRRAAAS